MNGNTRIQLTSLEMSTFMVAVVNTDRKYSFVDEKFANFLGLSREEIIGKTMGSIINDTEVGKLLKQNVEIAFGDVGAIGARLFVDEVCYHFNMVRGGEVSDPHTTVTVFLHDITHHIRLAQEYEASAKLIAAANSTGATLMRSGKPSWDEVRDSVAKFAVSLNVDVAAVYRRKKGGGNPINCLKCFDKCFQYEHGWERDVEGPMKARSIEHALKTNGCIMKRWCTFFFRGEAVYGSNGSIDETEAVALTAHKIRSFCAIPINVAPEDDEAVGALWGFIVLANMSPREWGPFQVEAARAVANGVGVSILRARKAEDEEKRLQRAVTEMDNYMSQHRSCINDLKEMSVSPLTGDIS